MLKMRTDFKWRIGDTDYIIRNVPCEEYGGEKVFNLDVSIKVATIRDLMVMNEIPHDVDFKLAEDIEF